MPAGTRVPKPDKTLLSDNLAFWQSDLKKKGVEPSQIKEIIAQRTSSYIRRFEDLSNPGNQLVNRSGPVFDNGCLLTKKQRIMMWQN